MKAVWHHVAAALHQASVTKSCRHRMIAIVWRNLQRQLGFWDFQCDLLYLLNGAHFNFEQIRRSCEQWETFNLLLDVKVPAFLSDLLAAQYFFGKSKVQIVSLYLESERFNMHVSNGGCQFL